MELQQQRQQQTLTPGGLDVITSLAELPDLQEQLVAEYEIPERYVRAGARGIAAWCIGHGPGFFGLHRRVEDAKVGR